MASYSGSLIPRVYSQFRGVDFSNKDVSLVRSPDSLNMWKDYKNDLGKSVETRPDIELVDTYDNTIFGLFFYKIGSREMQLVHCGTQLIKVENGEKVVLKENGLNPMKSNAFVYNNIWYFKDGLNYLQYDGQTLQEVVGYVPTTTISRTPKGGGTLNEDVNMLSDYRINSFCADGTKDYQLDVEEFDNEPPVVWVKTLVNDHYEDIYYIALTDYTWDRQKGLISFIKVPSKPLNDGEDNVFIKFKKEVPEYKERIKRCTLLEVFDNRVFFSGNEDYPNTLWHSSLNEPSYVSDLDYYNEGLDLAPVKSMVAGNNALWVFKEPSQANTTIFYHNPVIDGTYGKTYPSTHSSISTGCVALGRNFNDDIVFFSERGMEAINGDVTTEQVVMHRSSLVDSRLTSELNYKNMMLEEYEGYLLVIIDNKIYLADSREMYQQDTHYEYEWFYWEFDKNITNTIVKDGILYVCCDNELYTLTNDSEDRLVNAYWTTPEDDFGVPQYLKTTNKRGCVTTMVGNELTMSAKTDNNEYEEIGTYENSKGYVVSRIKRKKWKSIQLKLSSNKPFGLFSCTLESYVGSYVKR